MGRDLRSSFRGSSFSFFSLSFSVNKGSISSFFFQGQKAAHKSKGSSNFLESSANSSINSAYSCSCSHCSSIMVTIKHTFFLGENIFFAEVKNVELQCHIAKSELHNPISTVDDCIRGSQEWPPEYNGHIIGSHSY